MATGMPSMVPLEGFSLRMMGLQGKVDSTARFRFWPARESRLRLTERRAECKSGSYTCSRTGRPT